MTRPAPRSISNMRIEHSTCQARAIEAQRRVLIARDMTAAKARTRALIVAAAVAAAVWGATLAVLI